MNPVEIDIPTAKQRLRERTIAWREAQPATLRQGWSRDILHRATALAAFGRAHTVLTYASIGSEVDTWGLMRRILTRGKRLVLPRIEAGALVLYAVRDPDTDLVPGVWGIREPCATLERVPVQTVDLCLLPGLAFDPAGGRLGYGRGYFDRLLADVRPFMAGLAFDGQVVERVPKTMTDVPMNRVITPSRTIRPRSPDATV